MSVTTRDPVRTFLLEAIEHAQKCSQNIHSDPDGLHQLRVSLRRLRALIAVWRDDLRLPDALRQDLRNFNRHLALARDWEVLYAQTLPRLLSGNALIQWQQQLSSLNESAHQQVQDLLTRNDLSKLLDACRNAIESDLSTCSSDADFKRRAEKMLKRQRRALVHHLRHLDKASPPKRHALRIRIKKARYTAETVSGAPPRRSMQRYLKQLTVLQDRLGQMQDLVVAAHLIQENFHQLSLRTANLTQLLEKIDIRLKKDGQTLNPGRHRLKRFKLAL